MDTLEEPLPEGSNIKKWLGERLHQIKSKFKMGSSEEIRCLLTDNSHSSTETWKGGEVVGRFHHQYKLELAGLEELLRPPEKKEVCSFSNWHSELKNLLQNCYYLIGTVVLYCSSTGTHQEGKPVVVSMIFLIFKSRLSVNSQRFC